MSERWRQRPAGSNWGDFGSDDPHGRMNLVTPHRRLAAIAEVRAGLAFCLSLPLDLPGGNVVNPRRHPPCFHPIMRDGHVAFNLPMERIDPSLTDVTSDEAVMLYTHYSTHWDGFAHRGSMFDADGDGTAEAVFYNGVSIVDPVTGQGTQGQLGAVAASIAEMAETCAQGRGVLVDLHRHFGLEGVEVGFDALSRILQEDGVVIEEGDILCLHTGLGQRILEAGGKLDASIGRVGAALDGRDERLLAWITESGVAAIAADNIAVERVVEGRSAPDVCHRGPGLPLHDHCLFKLGIHLGELWYLTELSGWLHENGRSRFLLTAPPLRLPGASASPTTPVATV